MRTTTERTSNCFWAIWPMTMFELSPSVVTTTASALLDARAAQQRDVHAVPDVELTAPLLTEPPKRLLALIDDAHLPAG